jgi:hypothetical protein
LISKLRPKLIHKIDSSFGDGIVAAKDLASGFLYVVGAIAAEVSGLSPEKSRETNFAIDYVCRRIAVF